MDSYFYQLSRYGPQEQVKYSANKQSEYNKEFLFYRLVNRAMDILSSSDASESEVESARHFHHVFHHLESIADSAFSALAAAAAAALKDLYKVDEHCDLSDIPQCDEGDRFRTIDGTCNNLGSPRFGAANIAMRRYLPAVYPDGAGR